MPDQSERDSTLCWLNAMQPCDPRLGHVVSFLTFWNIVVAYYSFLETR